MGVEKKQQQGHHAATCNIHNATMPATEEPTTAETLARAWVPARAWVKTRAWTPVRGGPTTKLKKGVVALW
jgi:hypothetical protein